MQEVARPSFSQVESGGQGGGWCFSHLQPLPCFLFFFLNLFATTPKHPYTTAAIQKCCTRKAFLENVGILEKQKTWEFILTSLGFVYFENESE